MANIKAGTRYKIKRDGLQWKAGTVVYTGAPSDNTATEILIWGPGNKAILFKTADLEIYAPTLSELKEELISLGERAADVRNEINYMEETGAKKFVDREYNIWRTFDILGQPYDKALADELEVLYYGD